MINVYVVPEMAFIEGADLKDSLVISIVSPGREHPKIIGTNVHKFHFHDVTQVYEYDDGRLIMPMSETVASQIAEVALKNVSCSEWVIHCEAGISRSPGVAIALSKFIKLNPNRRMLKKAFPLYNKHVALLIENAMEIKMKELEVKIELDAKCGGEEDIVFESIDMSVGILHTSQEHPTAIDVRFAKFNGEVFCGHCRKDLWEIYKGPIGKEG